MLSTNALTCVDSQTSNWCSTTARIRSSLNLFAWESSESEWDSSFEDSDDPFRQRSIPLSFRIYLTFPLLWQRVLPGEINFMISWDAYSCFSVYHFAGRTKSCLDPTPLPLASAPSLPIWVIILFFLDFDSFFFDCFDAIAIHLALRVRDLRGWSVQRKSVHRITPSHWATPSNYQTKRKRQCGDKNKGRASYCGALGKGCFVQDGGKMATANNERWFFSFQRGITCLAENLMMSGRMLTLQIHFSP